ncbi:MAG: cytochrome c3 family protein [Thermosulfidibacteraceae bacterium]|jgi:nitrate/TMAO reductase-like tetraheme cytochrome c subunit
MKTWSTENLIILLIIVIVTLPTAPEISYGIPSQLCSNCHTMHASYFEGPTHKVTTPRSFLLKIDCIGCHSGSSGPTSFPYNAPIVYHTSNPGGTGPGKTLAGGDFYWVAQSGGDRKGHNVAGIANNDITLGLTPPGWDPTATSGFIYGQVANGANPWNKQLTCAGTYGCHGNHNFQDPLVALKGAHHNNAKVNNSATKADSTTVSTYTVAGSYRFLANIYGLEAVDWEWNATNATHNEYYGVNGNANYNNKNTISYLCAECHGYFHSNIGSGSPWLRHPTDIALPSDTNKDYTNYRSYNLAVPVARPTVPSNSSSTVTPGQDIVICLSCHRAHGSENDYILRWDYKNWPSNGQTIGCSVCHISKY